MSAPAPNHSPSAAAERWLRLEAARTESESAAAEAALAEAFQALPPLAPSAGFVHRVVALAVAPVIGVAPAFLGSRSRFGWSGRLALAASLGLSGSAWLTARAWAPVIGDWLRPGELIDAAAFAVRESAFVFVRGLAAWQVFAEVSDALLRVLTMPDSAAVTAAVALAALGAFHALRGVLASERSVYRV